MKINSSVEMDVDAKEGLLRKNDQINGMIFNYHGNQEDKWRQEFNKSFLFDRGILRLESWKQVSEEF